MNIAAIKTALYAWAVLALNDAGVTVYWDEPDGPRPPNPAVRFKFVSGPTMVGLDEMRPTDADPAAFAIVGPRTFILSASAYGDTSADLISTLQTSASDPAKVQALGVAGVGILSFGPPRDLSELLETKWERRHQVDVNLLVTEYVATAAGIIENLEATSTINPPDGGDPISGNVTVP